MYFLLTFFILFIAFFVLFFHFRKKQILKKLACMTLHEKCCLLDELCAPLGYCYDCRQSIFSARVDAWQKDFGYTYAFDRFAPFFNMVFDSLPVYFDYAGRTWLIEFWKGQYGITTGAEIGVYHADGIIPESRRDTTIFEAASEEEMLELSFSLQKEELPLACLQKRHWWLTAFCVGMFSYPKELCMNVSIVFPNCEMLSAFTRAMLELGFTSGDLSACGHRLSFTFRTSRHNKCGFFCRFNRRFALWRDKLLCRFYSCIVRPLTDTADQILYLYFYLPSVFRRTFRLHAHGRKCRRKHRKNCKCFYKQHKKHFKDASGD